jgi:DNA-binding Lrp family transcriptional regulator
LSKDPSIPQIDETDYGLLALVQKDGRAPNTKLAKKLHLSETPCWRRLKRLEDKGIIKGYQANLDRRLLGFGVLAFVQICFAIHTDDSPEKFEEAIQGIPEVLSCHNVTGESDYLLQIVSTDLETYEKLLRRVLRKLPGVTSIKSSFCLREVKASTHLPLTTTGKSGKIENHFNSGEAHHRSEYHSA